MNKQGDKAVDNQSFLLRQASKLRKGDMVLNFGVLTEQPTRHFGYNGIEMMLLTFRYTRIEAPEQRFFFVEVETSRSIQSKIDNADPSPRMRAAAIKGVTIE